MEGSWVQEFPKSSFVRENKENEAQNREEEEKTVEMSSIPSSQLVSLKNDFGRVLFDFFMHQVWIYQTY